MTAMFCTTEVDFDTPDRPGVSRRAYVVHVSIPVIAEHVEERPTRKGAAERLQRELQAAAEIALDRLKDEGLIDG